MAPTAMSLLAAAAALALPQAALADLRSAVHRSAPKTGASLPMPSALTGPLMVPLQRVEARASTEHADRESFYVGTLSVGQPAQELRVMFDTSSGHIQVPHRACKDRACLEHRQYSPWGSSTAMDVNVDGKLVQADHRLVRGRVKRDGVNVSVTHADLGSGFAQGALVRDGVCLGGASRTACVDMTVMAAVHMDEHPFLAMPNDGIVGLGMQTLAASPLCSFFERLMEGSSNVIPQFGIFLGADKGEIYLGGHDTRHLTAPIQWLPVDHPDSGYWQVALKAVRVGNVTVNDCSEGCHAVVDSGASRIGVQDPNLEPLRAALAAGPGPEGGCQGPDLTFDLGSVALTLRAEDYAGSDCVPELGPLELDKKDFVGVYTLGETVLRRYYAAFDWKAKRVGFAPATWRPAASEGETMFVL